MSNENTSTNAAVPVKEDKHLSIEQAINSLDEVISHAQNILDKALGHPSSIGCDKPDYARLTLSEFLDNSGTNIREKIETLHSQLSQIESTIF
jgi:CHAD domain-containing protein